MFGFGHGPELIIILVVALIILGPGKIPEVAQTLGKGLRELRKASADLQRTFDVNELMNPTPAAPPEPAPPVMESVAVAEPPNTIAPIHGATPVGEAVVAVHPVEHGSTPGGETLTPALSQREREIVAGEATREKDPKVGEPAYSSFTSLPPTAGAEEAVKPKRIRRRPAAVTVGELNGAAPDEAPVAASSVAAEATDEAMPPKPRARRRPSKVVPEAVSLDATA